MRKIFTTISRQSPKTTLLVKYVAVRTQRGKNPGRQEFIEQVRTTNVSRTLKSLHREARKAALPVDYIQVYELVQTRRLAEYKVKHNTSEKF